MIRWAGCVLGTSFMRLIRRGIIFTIVDTITNLSLRDAATIQTRKFPVSTRRVLTIQLIRSILAVILMIALPRFKDAASVVAPELVR